MAASGSAASSKSATPASAPPADGAAAATALAAAEPAVDGARTPAAAPPVGRPRIPALVQDLSALLPGESAATSNEEALALAQKLLFDSELAGHPKRPDADTTTRLFAAATALAPRGDGSHPRVFCRGSSEDRPTPSSTSSVGVLAAVEQATRTQRVLAEHFGDADLSERALETADTLQMALHWTQVLARAVELLTAGLQSALAAPPPADSSAEPAKLRAERDHAVNEAQRAFEALAIVTEERDKAQEDFNALVGQNAHALRMLGGTREFIQGSVGGPLPAAHFLSAVYPPPTCSLPALYALLQACTGAGDPSIRDRVVLVAMAAPGAVLPDVPDLPEATGPDGSTAGSSSASGPRPASRTHSSSGGGTTPEPQGDAPDMVVESPQGHAASSEPAVASLLSLGAREPAGDSFESDPAPDYGDEPDVTTEDVDEGETMLTEPAGASSPSPPVAGEPDASVEDVDEDEPMSIEPAGTSSPTPSVGTTPGVSEVAEEAPSSRDRPEPVSEPTSLPAVRETPEGGHAAESPSSKRSRTAPPSLSVFGSRPTLLSLPAPRPRTTPPSPSATPRPVYTVPTMPTFGSGVGALTVNARLSDAQTTRDRFQALRASTAYQSVLVVARNLVPRQWSEFEIAQTDVSFPAGVTMGTNPRLPVVEKSDKGHPVARKTWRDHRVEVNGEKEVVKMQLDVPNSVGYPNYIVWRTHSAPVFSTYSDDDGFDHYVHLMHQRPWDAMWARRVTRFYLIDPTLLDAACHRWLIDYFRFMYAYRQAFWELYHWVHSPHVNNVGHASWRQLLSQRGALVQHLRGMAARLKRPSTWPPGYDGLVEAEPALWFIPKAHCTWVPEFTAETPSAEKDPYVLARQLEQLHREEPIRVQYGGCPARMVESLGSLSQWVFYLHHYAQVSWKVPAPFNDPSYTPVPPLVQLIGTPGPIFYDIRTPGSSLDVAWRRQYKDIKYLSNIDAPHTVAKMLEPLVDVHDRIKGAQGAKATQAVEIVDSDGDEKPLPQSPGESGLSVTATLNPEPWPEEKDSSDPELEEKASAPPAAEEKSSAP